VRRTVVHSARAKHPVACRCLVFGAPPARDFGCQTRRGSAGPEDTRGPRASNKLLRLTLPLHLLARHEELSGQADADEGPPTSPVGYTLDS
jgi:hypothetical protein